MYSLYSIIYRLSFTTRIWTFLLKFQLGQSVEMPFSHQNPDKNRTRTGSGQCCPLNSVLHLVQKLKNSAVPSWSPFWAEKLSIVFYMLLRILESNEIRTHYLSVRSNRSIRGGTQGPVLYWFIEINCMYKQHKLSMHWYRADHTAYVAQIKTQFLSLILNFIWKKQNKRLLYIMGRLQIVLYKCWSHPSR